ncbi:DUF2147 domain-containing protein [Stappia sp.]|uniref:DUF2147 domain-containing protein n=1 Tax=Stappia sp. TaxID=1870903 RepID=UPI0032D95895
MKGKTGAQAAGRCGGNVARTWRVGCVGAATLLAMTSAASADLAAVAGDWRTPAGATVRISDCGSSACGRIVDFPPPPGETVETTRDVNNRDPAKRDRKILGLAVLFRLQPAEGGLKGRVYDPRRGFSAEATVTRADADRLTVRGCVRLAFRICESETWRRAR